MHNENLTFSFTDDNGKQVECTIISLIPKGDGDGYVVFVDGEIDENNTPYLKYGLLVKDDNGDYQIKKGVSEEELEYIKDVTGDNLIDIAKELVNNQLNNKE